VIVPAALGVWLLAHRRVRPAMAATAIWLFFTWWLGMDFGVVGGTGTDPNIALPVGLFLAVAWIGLFSGDRAVIGPLGTEQTRGSAEHRLYQPAEAPVAMLASAGAPPSGTVQEAGSPVEAAPARSGPWLVRHPVRTWLVGAMAAAALWTVIPVLTSIPTAVNSPSGITLGYLASGGMAAIPGDPRAPEFTLENQHGVRTSLASFRGKVVLLTFLDPVCYATCPVVAQELAQVAALLG